MVVVTAVACGARSPRVATPETAVIAWLAHDAVAVDDVDPAAPLDDLAPLATMIGGARIVGLGEATHGTREFFQLKHRLVEYAVARLGFTVFGIEAGEPECRAIDEYIRTGRGDPRTTLQLTPIWDTEEVVALIDWMRAWNADPSHDRKVKFVGFDMQTPIFAYRSVVAFLTTVAPDQVAALTSTLAVLDGNVGTLGAVQWGDLLHAIDAIATGFDANRVAWTALAGATRFAEARHDVTVMAQGAHSYQMSAAEDEHSEDVRDRAMADNVTWILGQEPPGTRMLLWAHNGHVALQAADQVTMGSRLRATFGRAYLSIGFLFGEGTYRTIELRDGRAVSTEHTIGASSAGDAAGPFVATGAAVLVADLRVARGPVAAWFAAPHALREAGGTYVPEAQMTEQAVLSSRHDLVIFVAHMTASRSLRYRP